MAIALRSSLRGILTACLLVQTIVHPLKGGEEAARIHTRLDNGWKFLLGDPDDAQQPATRDDSWRTVTLPHDWSIEGQFDPKAPMGGAGGFLPAGIGWYRKHFNVPPNWAGKRVSVEFEGVYMNADVWCNGRHLATHPYGYTSFQVDLTPSLQLNGDNVLAVRVDNSQQKNSRWYSGSGIYRHVWLTVTGPTHIAPWGVFVSVPKAAPDLAAVSVQTTIANETDSAERLQVTTSFLSPSGHPVGGATANVSVAPHSTSDVTQQREIPHPALWTPENPRISTVKTTLLKGGAVVDEVITRYGIRSLSWSANKGLQLNGTTLKINGGCIHADNGVLGCAAFDRAEERKIQILKGAGFNGIRTAHAPPSPALLDACDRLGMLVMEDAFDCWFKGKNAKDYHLVFKDWWKRDIDSMVLRDRNHPSIVFWNIGNEIPEVLSPDGVSYNHRLIDAVHALDKTRPATNAILGWPGSDKMANAEEDWSAEDIVGSNYALSNHIKQHAQHPGRILVSTESKPGRPAIGWGQVTKLGFVVDDNVWSAQDYLGESGIGRWFYIGDPTEPMDSPKSADDKVLHPVGHGNDRLFPWHGALCGEIDLIGDRKPMSHLRNIVWDEGEKLYMAVQQPEDDNSKILVVGWGFFPAWESWTWPGWEGKKMTVDIYSRYSSVRLYANGRAVGDHDTGEGKGFRTTFDLPYEPGTIKVVGLQNGQEMGDFELSTVQAPASIRLTPDRARIQANSQDLSFVEVEVLDKDGRVQPNADREITFTLSGPATIAGLGNANMKSVEPYQGTRCRVFHGKGLVVLRSTDRSGTCQLKAQASGLTDGVCSVQTVPAPL